MSGVTNPALWQEIIVAPWQTMLRGAKIIERPYDVMWDIDDVIFPTIASIHTKALAAGLHDGTAKMRWTGWESYTLPSGEPCTPEIYWDLWADFAIEEGYTKTPPIPGAAEALRRLYFAGHRIHLVTARGFMDHSETIREATKVWVEEFGIPWHTLTFARDKVAAMGDILKLSPNPDNACKNTFDFAIDDSPKNFEALFDAGVESFLLDHEHNEEYKHPMHNWIHGQYRVASPTEYVNIIEEQHEHRTA